MTAEYILATDAPKYILISGEGDLEPFKNHLDGDIIEGFDAPFCRIPFTNENAVKLRTFLRGKDYEIPPRERTILKFLADHPDSVTNDKIRWATKLTDLRANKLNKKLAKIQTEWDLIHYFPLRYLDKSNPQKVTDLVLGQWAVVAGTVQEVETNYQHSFVKIVISDITGRRIAATFFRQIWLSKKYRQGDEVIIYGNYSEYVNKKTNSRYPQILNPSIDKITTINPSGQGYGMLPIYPQKSENRSWQLKVAQEALLESIIWIDDPVPSRILEKYDLPSRADAYRMIHFPEDKTEVERARRRIAFDEFVRLQVYLQSRRDETEVKTASRKDNHEWADRFINSLPFTFTNAQTRVVNEIRADLQNNHPMHRLLQGDVGSGKAQPLYSKVLTPNGFTTMGEIQPGDEVLTPEGGVETVIETFPQGTRPVYELTFRDGSKVRADLEHLWKVTQGCSRYKNGEVRRSRVVTTEFLLNNLKRKNGVSAGTAQWFVEYPEEISDYGQEWSSIIAPYTLGALLGDGNLTPKHGVRFHADDDSKAIVGRMKDELGITMRLSEARLNLKTNKTTNEFWMINSPKALAAISEMKTETTVANFSTLIQKGYLVPEIKQHLAMSKRQYLDFCDVNTFDAKEIRKQARKNIIVSELERLDIHGSNSWNKKIPESLLNSNKESRIALLQGLLDTDGSCPKATYKSIEFTSVSEELASGVAHLIRSLAGKASMRRKIRKSGNSWSVQGWLPEGIEPFTVSYKKERYSSQLTRPLKQAKAIVDIKYVGEEETKCILLTGEEHLYLTDDFTVTHNTEIASTAILSTVASGYQAAMLAPTDILANQLYERLDNTFKKTGLDVNVALFTGKVLGKKRATLLEQLANGEIDVVVGTHTLTQDYVKFQNLGLAVIDESHKYGSEQRTALKKENPDGSIPDFLTMSATPIPRTTAQVIYGDMDISIVDELPANRLPIQTFWNQTPDEAWAKIREEVEQGHKAYVVAALVEDSDKESMADIESATSTAVALQQQFPNFKVELLHGKMKKNEKSEISDRFLKGDSQILVATSLIEVGLNHPDATVMVVLNANRFGIASLHQIRGRVGRSDLQSYCYLVGEATMPEAEERLNALVSSNDGFWLAEKDLEIRGEGELFGRFQSGSSDLYLANLKEHKDLLEIAKRVGAQAGKNPVMQYEVSTLYKDKKILS